MALFMELFNESLREMTVVNIDAIQKMEVLSSRSGKVLQHDSSCMIPSALGFSDRLAYCVAKGQDLEADDAVARPVAALIRAKKGCHSSGASEAQMLSYLEAWLTKDEIEIVKSVADFNAKLSEINGLKPADMLSLAQTLELAKVKKESKVTEKPNDKLIPVRKPAGGKGFGRRG